jgi:hypothetical protein
MLSYTSNYEYPVLVGDILITSASKDNNLSIPTHLDGLKSLLEDYEQSGNPSELDEFLYDYPNDKLDHLAALIILIDIKENNVRKHPASHGFTRI